MAILQDLENWLRVTWINKDQKMLYGFGRPGQKNPEACVRQGGHRDFDRA